MKAKESGEKRLHLDFYPLVLNYETTNRSQNYCVERAFDTFGRLERNVYSALR